MSGDTEDEARTLGGYRILRTLGATAERVVYLGRNADGEEAALKTFRMPPSARARLRLEREAELLRSLEHPVLVPLLAAECAAPLPYLALEYVEAPTLAELLAEGPLEPGLALALGEQLAAGLAHAHERGVLHRDLKAQNVLVQDRQARLIDWGVGRSLDHLNARATVRGGLVGTLASMAPEQLSEGLSSSQSDVYSLGVLLFEALSGRPPFAARTPLELFREVTAHPVPSLPWWVRVPRRVRALLARTLAKDPQARPSASEVAQELALAGREPASAPLPLLALLGTGALALVLVALSAGGQSSTDPSRESGTGSRAVASPSARSPSLDELLARGDLRGARRLTLPPGASTTLVQVRGTDAVDLAGRESLPIPPLGAAPPEFPLARGTGAWLETRPRALATRAGERWVLIAGGEVERFGDASVRTDAPPTLVGVFLADAGVARRVAQEPGPAPALGEVFRVGWSRRVVAPPSATRLFLGVSSQLEGVPGGYTDLRGAFQVEASRFPVGIPGLGEAKLEAEAEAQAEILAAARREREALRPEAAAALLEAALRQRSESAALLWELGLVLHGLGQRRSLAYRAEALRLDPTVERPRQRPLHDTPPWLPVGARGGTPEGWRAFFGGAWRRSDQGLAALGERTALLAPEQLEGDYALSVEIRVHEGQQSALAGLVFACSGRSSFESLTLRWEGPGPAAWLDVSWRDHDVSRARAAVRLERGTWAGLQVEVRGEEARVLLGGQERARLRVPGGKLGWGLIAGSQQDPVQFRAWRVERL